MTCGAASSVDPVTDTLPVAPGRVHSGATSVAGAALGQPAAGAVTDEVATSVTDGAPADVVSVSEPHAARRVTSEVAQAAKATDDGTRESFTLATLPAGSSVAGSTVRVAKARCRGANEVRGCRKTARLR